MKIPSTDMISPPIVPAANGNQKASFPVPTMNGIKPQKAEAMPNRSMTDKCNKQHKG